MDVVARSSEPDSKKLVYVGRCKENPREGGPGEAGGGTSDSRRAVPTGGGSIGVSSPGRLNDFSKRGQVALYGSRQPD